MTRAAFENAIKVTIALGGSTNAVLHLLAMAHAIGWSWNWMTLPGSARTFPCWRTSNPAENI